MAEHMREVRADSESRLPFSALASVDANPEGLSSRQSDVVALIADGLSTKEIAARLKVSAKTIESHRAAAMTRLQLFSVAELTKYAVMRGLSTLNGPSAALQAVAGGGRLITPVEPPAPSAAFH